MWLVQIALRRPYTFVVLSLLIALFGIRAALLTPTDIFPNIDIPVVSVVWTYNGLQPSDMSSRVIYYYERTLTSQVERHRAYRIAVAQRLWRGQDLLPEGSQHCLRHGAGDGGVADRAQAIAARHHAALRPELQCVERADPAACPVEPGAAADEAVRFRSELHPATARHGPRARRCPRPMAARFCRCRSISTSRRCSRTTFRPRISSTRFRCRT